MATPGHVADVMASNNHYVDAAPHLESPLRIRHDTTGRDEAGGDDGGGEGGSDGVVRTPRPTSSRPLIEVERHTPGSTFGGHDLALHVAAIRSPEPTVDRKTHKRQARGRR